MQAARCYLREEQTHSDSPPQVRSSAVLHAAGFHDVEELNKNLPWTWPGDAEEVFDYACAVAAPFRPMLERVPEEKWPAIRAEAIAAIERYRVGNEIRFGADVVFAQGKA